mmetsp:Transcript_34399/g.96993  ORF Transcript_34399/g.96993 Transcript_34399/m.96993 type:complete len:111 (+) Transcript_34399:27-359(+)|eukprot:CAMPEP_0119133350 /NCGR_PEP_ID=MMETSP1310-20130426/13330_1 /TAXON_ID=464262 /ORGANISM="Genus nov. species nov., Strain RCC2339" /LENGTH=110 /DNA_ID=CAMNT_0007124037 /DNA_START=25 /DNA_END=357 /DNA_ORIENTATION=+
MSFEGYRQTKLGDSLVSALEELMQQGRLDPEQAMVFLTEFDKSIAEKLETECKLKGMINGDLHTYRHYDDVYYIFAKDVTFSFNLPFQDRESVYVDKLKCMIQKAPEEDS